MCRGRSEVRTEEVRTEAADAPPQVNTPTPDTVEAAVSTVKSQHSKTHSSAASEQLKSKAGSEQQKSVISSVTGPSETLPSISDGGNGGNGGMAGIVTQGSESSTHSIVTRNSGHISLLPTPKAADRGVGGSHDNYTLGTHNEIIGGGDLVRKGSGLDASEDSTSGDSDAGELPRDDEEEEDLEPKIQDFNILLLGGPNVGKSTVFKQLQMIYGSGFSEDQVGVAKRQVVLQVFRTILNVVESSFSLKLDVPFSSDTLELVEDFQSFADEYDAEVQNTGGLGELPIHPSQQVWDNVMHILNDLGFQAVLANLKDPTQNHSSLRFDQHFDYFLATENLDRITSQEFEPTTSDILRVRVITIGSERIEFNMDLQLADSSIERLHVTCTDVGGQAHEQEEWRRIYEAQEVHAILYICALSEFDNVDKATDKNALTEQFRLLRRVMENEVFSQSSTIVLLNKIDILETKLEHRDMSDFMSGFKKKNNNVDGVVNTFIKKVKKTHEKLQDGKPDKSRPQPVVLASCALDTSLMETLICQALRQTLVRNLNKFFE